MPEDVPTETTAASKKALKFKPKALYARTSQSEREAREQAEGDRAREATAGGRGAKGRGRGRGRGGVADGAGGVDRGAHVDSAGRGARGGARGRGRGVDRLDDRTAGIASATGIFGGAGLKEHALGKVRPKGLGKGAGAGDEEVGEVGDRGDEGLNGAVRGTKRKAGTGGDATTVKDGDADPSTASAGRPMRTAKGTGGKSGPQGDGLLSWDAAEEKETAQFPQWDDEFDDVRRRIDIEGLAHAQTSALAMRPVRLDRAEHVQRSIGVSTTATAAAVGVDGASHPTEPIVHETGRANASSLAARDIKTELVDDTSFLGVGDDDDLVHLETSRRRLRVAGYQTQLPANSIENALHDPDFDALVSLWKQVMEDSEQHTQRSLFDGLKGNPDRTGKIYLLQLPPIIPHLHDPTDKPANSTTQPSALGIEASANSKSEPTTDAQVSKDTEHSEATSVGTIDSLPSGVAGTLTFFDSGKMAVNWGGMSLEVNEAPSAGLLQQLVAYNEHVIQPKLEPEPFPIGDDQESPATRGQAWDLGVVREGFIVTPDWDVLLGAST